MKCEEILKALDLYLDGDEANATCVAFQKHLADCERCRIVVDTIQKTVKLFKDDEQQVEMPEHCQQKLHDMLRKKWDERKN